MSPWTWLKFQNHFLFSLVVTFLSLFSKRRLYGPSWLKFRKINCPSNPEVQKVHTSLFKCATPLLKGCSASSLSHGRFCRKYAVIIKFFVISDSPSLCAWAILSLTMLCSHHETLPSSQVQRWYICVLQFHCSCLMLYQVSNKLGTSHLRFLRRNLTARYLQERLRTAVHVKTYLVALFRVLELWTTQTPLSVQFVHIKAPVWFLNFSFRVHLCAAIKNVFIRHIIQQTLVSLMFYS